jgi:poly(3-hydroxybutyrate) depolymerase
MKIFLVLFTFINILFSNEMEKVFIDYENEKRHYLIYKPHNYNDNQGIDLVIGLHGYNGSASGFESEVTGGFNKLANKYNFIAVYPESLNFYDGETLVTTFNDIIRPTNYEEISSICLSDNERIIYPKFPNCDRGRCGWAPCVDDASFIKSIIDTFKNKFKINNVYMIGNSSGGTFVNSYVCKYPKSITAAISINGMSRSGFGCTPDHPVNFISYASLRDTSVPPVGGLSTDGLFYETQENLIKNWVDKFACKNQVEKTYEHYETYKETTFSNCIGNIKIISILNLDADHMWPEAGYNKDTGQSTYTNFGTCVSSIQKELNIPKCYRTNDGWGSEFILKKLFSTNNIN